MKLWKGATFAFMLCGAALSVLLIRNMAAVGHFRPRTKHSSSSYSSSSSSSSSRASSSSQSSLPWPSSSTSSSAAAAVSGPHRRTRSTDNMNSLLNDFTAMLQSFTEGELQHVVGTLLDRKRRRSQARRTKRARRPKPCSVRELELTVSELGLGYDSDETMVLRYCSGKCTAHRHNYDITMERMMRTGFKEKGRKDKVGKGPCCRPISFEKDFSFLDNRSRYHTIRNVSAKNCGQKPMK